MRRGTTVFPAVIAVLVLALLAVMALQSGRCGPQSTIEGKVPYDLKYLHEMVEHYAKDHDGRWPTSMDDLLRTEAGSGPYLKDRLLDPWKNEYLFLPPITPDGRPRIGTLGEDARPGGKCEDADYDDRMVRSAELAGDS